MEDSNSEQGSGFSFLYNFQADSETTQPLIQ
jgi:hypothetical protein